MECREVAVAAVDGGRGKLLERSACWPMCGGLEEWRSDGGDGAWFLQPTEKVTESGNCIKLGVTFGGGSIGDLEMALEMASRLWTMVSAGVTVRMVR